MLSIVLHVLLSLNVVVALLIILVVLMQRPKNEGLGAAFGGGVTENLFGVQTTNVLANLTRWLGGIFFLNSLILTYLYAHMEDSGGALERRLKQSSALVAPPLPAATPATAPAALPATPGAEGAVPVPPPAAAGTEAPAPAAPGASTPASTPATPGVTAPAPAGAPTLAPAPATAPAPAALPAAGNSAPVKPGAQ